MANEPESEVENYARKTIDNLIGGKVGRQTRGDLNDALKRADRDSNVGRSIGNIGKGMPESGRPF